MSIARVAQRVDVAGDGDVRDAGDGLRAGGLDGGTRRGEVLGVDVGEDEPHSFGREPLGQRAADAARRAGNDRDAARQLLHVSRPCQSPYWRQ